MGIEPLFLKKKLSPSLLPATSSTPTFSGTGKSPGLVKCGAGVSSICPWPEVNDCGDAKDQRQPAWGDECEMRVKYRRFCADKRLRRTTLDRTTLDTLDESLKLCGLQQGVISAAVQKGWLDA